MKMNNLRLTIFVSKEAYEREINTLNAPGLYYCLELNEWFDGNRHTLPLPYFYQEMLQEVLKG